MSEVGSVTWRDLTVPDADQLSAFYAAVVGWEVVNHDMGGYNDYEMHAPGAGCVAGICHAKGPNEGVPPQWLVYITVADLDKSIAECTARGGEVLHGPRDIGGQRMVVIRDPAGAVAGLITAPQS